MKIELPQFTALYDQFLKIDFTGDEPGIRPKLANARDVQAATAKGAPRLPLLYRQGFAAPMDAALPHVLDNLAHEMASGEKTKAEAQTRLEVLYAPVYQHAPGLTKVNAGPQLKRFLAVVSNLFRSFSDADKRTAAGVNLVTLTPPLACFQADTGRQGPYTIESDLMQQHLGIEIGIVSLPATYRDHPVIWSVLSHEVCGHDVVHADAGLLNEMIDAVQTMLAPNFAPHEPLDHAALNALLWSYWMDEAAADVYGALNLGPAFAPSLAAFLAAFRAHLKGGRRPDTPAVATEASPHDNEGGDDTLEDHPIDLLRFHLLLGAIDALPNLNPDVRAGYVTSIEAIATLIAGGVATIHVEGKVNLGSGKRLPVKEDIPLPQAADAARKVGRMIATLKFKALNGRSIQDIETWDDADEAAAQAIATRLQKNEPVVGLGDDAQLLAGATLALLRNAGLYADVQKRLNDALDDSFKTDPIWRGLNPSHVFAPHVFRTATEKGKKK